MVLDIGGGLFGQRDVRETEMLTNTRTRYLSIHSSGFRTDQPDVDNVQYDRYYVKASADGIGFYAPVNLPHGAVVTACVVYGDTTAAAETWLLQQNPLNEEFTNNTMAEAHINTEDTSISFPIINNSLNGYTIEIPNLDTNDEIWGARITYTIATIEV